MSASAHDNLIQGNLIGTDRTGTVALGNGNFGINVGGTSNQLGGAGSSVPRNVISGNGGAGIRLGGDHNTLLGNFIGTDLTGTKALANNGPGIYMLVAGANTIGDTSTGGLTSSPETCNRESTFKILPAKQLKAIESGPTSLVGHWVTVPREF